MLHVLLEPCGIVNVCTGKKGAKMCNNNFFATNVVEIFGRFHENSVVKTLNFLVTEMMHPDVSYVLQTPHAV